MSIIFFFFFFFSSRRRHTRWNCDWSSDVCSSDLGVLAGYHRLPARLDVGELAERHLERDRHPVQAVDRDRFLAALDLTDELAAERRPFAQPLLTEAFALAQ